jgi:hypothetical protein
MRKLVLPVLLAAVTLAGAAHGQTDRENARAFAVAAVYDRYCPAGPVHDKLHVFATERFGDFHNGGVEWSAQLKDVEDNALTNMQEWCLKVRSPHDRRLTREMHKKRVQLPKAVAKIYEVVAEGAYSSSLSCARVSCPSPDRTSDGECVVRPPSESISGKVADED